MGQRLIAVNASPFTGNRTAANDNGERNQLLDGDDGARRFGRDRERGTRTVQEDFVFRDAKTPEELLMRLRASGSDS